MTAVENISLSSFYEGIIENAESNIMILDNNFRIVTLNHGFYWAFLESFDVHLKKGERLFELIDPVIPEISAKWMSRCLSAKKGISISDEEEFNTAGHTFVWKIYYKAIRIGEAEFVSIFSRNITSAKLFQNRIAKHEANLRTIINSFNACIWLVNDKFDLIDFNENTFNHFLEVYDVRLQATRNFIDLLPNSLPELREMWHERLKIVSVTKEQTSFLDRQVFSGQEIVSETRIIPVQADGKIIGLTLSMEDITKRRIDEQVQRTQMNEILKLNADMDKFVYSASHELRSPLLSIVGVINLMKNEYPQDAIYLKHIESSLAKIDHFVTNIINFSRNNRIEVDPSLVDFPRIIKHVIDGLSYLEGAAIVKPQIRIENEETPFHSDVDRIQVIFRNVISNAFQYFDPWKASVLEITITITAQNARIVFADNGIGIRQEILDKTFEMFFRASDRSGGAGLGLYIAKCTVERLNGTIELESALGLGTTMTIEIPNLCKGA